jgi:hypothetical protein
VKWNFDYDFQGFWVVGFFFNFRDVELIFVIHGDFCGRNFNTHFPLFFLKTRGVLSQKLDSRGVRLYWYFEPYTLRNKNA